jgi:hypothetical protein
MQRHQDREDATLYALMVKPEFFGKPVEASTGDGKFVRTWGIAR